MQDRGRLQGTRKGVQARDADLCDHHVHFPLGRSHVDLRHVLGVQHQGSQPRQNPRREEAKAPTATASGHLSELIFGVYIHTQTHIFIMLIDH